MVIFYCDKCGQRVPDTDLESGSAAQLDDVRAICVRCGGRKATGFINRRASSKAATGPPPAAPLIEGLTPTGAHPETHARATSPQTPPITSNRFALWGGLTVGALVLVLIVVFAATRGHDSRTKHETTDRQPAAQRDIPLPPALPGNPPPTIPPVTSQTNPPPKSTDTATGGDYDPRAYVAASRLNEAKVYFNKNPNDPWGFNEQLENLKAGYQGTPAAIEAETLQKTLVLTGERPVQRMNWHLEWKSETDNRNDNHWTMDRSWDGRSFVLHTHPPERGKPAAFNRTVRVPEDRPYLTLRARGSDQGDFRGRVEVNGREMLSEIVAGREWRTFGVDLSEFKGREATIRIVHENTDWNSEHGHWLPPEFVAQKPADRTMFPPLSTATDWSKSIDLIAVAEPEHDALGGTWTLENGTLLGQADQSTVRLPIPYLPPAEYDVRAAITRTKGKGGFALNLPRDASTVTFILAGGNNAISGFEMIDGRDIFSSADKIVQKDTLQNDRPYRLVVQVRRGYIRCYLDDAPLIQTTASNEKFSVAGQRKMPNPAQLGLSVYDATYEIRDWQLLSVTGEGRGLRDAAQPRPETAVVAEPAAPVKANEYAVFLDDLLQTLSRQNWDGARKKFQEAARNPALADRAEYLKLDRQCTELAEKVPLAESKGLRLLTDGREFTLQTIDGKRYDVGGSRKMRIDRLSADGFDVKHTERGGTMFFKLPTSSLSPATRLELSQAALSAEADGTLAMAAYRLALLAPNAGAVEVKSVEELLTAAVPKNTVDDRVTHLRRWLAFRRHEGEARTALAALIEMLTGTDEQQIRNAFDAFRKNFGDTALVAAASTDFARIEERMKALAARPGLWRGSFKDDKTARFKELIAEDIISTIGFNLNVGARDKRWPQDFFSLRYCGLLRIEKPGTYAFPWSADDRARLWIDHQIVEKGKSIDLGEGNHAFKLEYEQDWGGEGLKFEWIQPGESNAAKIPGSAFWHVPGKREEYLNGQ